jgi:asparagine synthase (glutamine-hydrolysing)
MCGIAGMAGAADTHLLDAMLGCIVHRGPNDSGTFLERETAPCDQIAMGTRRLSIIDLSQAGHQPISNEDGSVWVAYNGEIYNFRALRQTLLSKGHSFRSQTDSEVLVHLYEEYGERLVEHINGMFAFALWDRRKKRLFLFRDRFGIKPLYYTQHQGVLYFGSEVKSLLCVPGLPVEIDAVALQQYLQALYVPNPRTMFRGIHKLEPGHFLEWDHGTVTTHSYWDLTYRPDATRSEEDWAAALRESLIKVVEDQLMSDVPVGFFLSGGVDSSTLLACAAQTGHTGLKCYSIAFLDQHGRFEQNSEDAHYARIVAQQYRADFREIVVEPRVVDLLPKAVWYLDEPVADHAAIATYLICDAARTEVTVLLSGQGGDEMFAGYRAHISPKLASYMRRLPKSLRRVANEKLVPALMATHARLPGVSPGLLRAAGRFTGRLLGAAELEPCAQYIAARSYFDGNASLALLSPQMRSAATGGDDLGTVFLRRFAEAAQYDFISQMLYVDAKTFLPDLNLAYSDKMSMAASIEVRVPFLDDRIADLALSIPSSLKIKGFKQKYILKKAMQGMLPDGVLHRRKAGFGLPVRSWLSHDLRDMVMDLLSPARVKDRGIFDADAVQKMLQADAGGEGDFTLPIWSLLTFELWQQAFIDSRTGLSVQTVP